jgi:hypothetical protein
MTSTLNDNCDLSWQIAREYMRAMEMAAQAVDIMAQLAKELEARYSNGDGAMTQKAVDAAGLTATDIASVFGPLRDCCGDRKGKALGLYEKVAIGGECFSQMARVRKAAK